MLGNISSNIDAQKEVVGSKIFPPPSQFTIPKKGILNYPVIVRKLTRVILIRQLIGGFVFHVISFLFYLLCRLMKLQYYGAGADV